MYFNIDCPASGMQKGDEASESIILAGRALLVKMIITLEPHGYIWFKICILMFVNIVQPLVGKNVTKLHQASFWPVELFW